MSARWNIGFPALYAGLDLDVALTERLKRTGPIAVRRLLGSEGWLATPVAVPVSARRPSVRRARPRRDRPGHRAGAHVRDPRTRPHPAGRPRAEGRSQRLVAGGGEGRPRCISILPAAS